MMPISDVAIWLALLPTVAAVVAVGAALRYRGEAARSAERAEALDKHVRMLEQETLYLVQQRLKAMEQAQWRGPRSGVPGPLYESLAGTEFAQAHESVLQMFSHTTEKAEQNAEGLLLAVARKLQGLANGQQLKINEMTERHDDSAFLEDLMQLDHTNAQILRRAVGMAVVCRAWPGRQHNATPLHDIVRGAIGRIRDYKRVHIVRIEDTRAVTGRVVEPLVMTIAELLENATRSSHPQTPVQVHVQLTHSGLAFVIEDAGVGLNAAEQEKATRLLNDGSLSLTKLGDPPRFGLVACGALARRYGFAVSVDTASAFGGVRAVVNLPRSLLTDPVRSSASPSAAAPPRRGAPESTPEAAADERAQVAAREPAPTAREDEEPAEPLPTTANGLPKRRRKQGAPSAGRTGQPPPVPDPSAADRTPREAAASIGAFQRAGKAAADRLRPSTEGTSEA